MPLKDVTIDINVQKVAGLVGLGKPLIVGTKTGGADYKNYSDLTSLAADFGETTAVYKKAKALLAQPNRPAVFAVAAYDPANNETAAELVQSLIDEDWFFLLSTETDVSKIEEIADVVEGTEKLFSTQVSTLAELQQLKVKTMNIHLSRFTRRPTNMLMPQLSGKTAAKPLVPSRGNLKRSSALHRRHSRSLKSRIFTMPAVTCTSRKPERIKRLKERLSAASILTSCMEKRG